MMGTLEENLSQEDDKDDFKGADLWDSARDSSGPPIAKRASQIEAKKSMSTQEESKHGSQDAKKSDQLDDPKFGKDIEPGSD